MKLIDHRRKRGASQEQVAVAVSLSSSSKGYISALERGAAHATIPLALKLEAWSGGEVPADSLLSKKDAELLAGHRKYASAQLCPATA